jgi:hypothetical protein
MFRQELRKKDKMFSVASGIWHGFFLCIGERVKMMGCPDSRRIGLADSKGGEDFGWLHTCKE